MLLSVFLLLLLYSLSEQWWANRGPYYLVTESKLNLKISRLVHKSDKTKLIGYILIEHIMIGVLQSKQA